MRTLNLTLVALILLGSAGCTRRHSAETSEHTIAHGRWLSVKRSAEAGRYSEAALSAVIELSSDFPDRRYAMWKWWETTFGERPDYLEMSRRFGDSLFTLYEQSAADRRRIIVEIFGRPHFDISRPSPELRREVEGDGKPKNG